MRPVRPNDLRIEQFIHQQIGGLLLRLISIKHEDAPQSKSGGRGSCLPAMVGLNGTRGDDRVGILSPGFSEQEFQFPRFIAPEGKTGLIIALDQYLRARPGLMIGEVTFPPALADGQTLFLE